MELQPGKLYHILYEKSLWNSRTEFREENFICYTEKEHPFLLLDFWETGNRYDLMVLYENRVGYVLFTTPHTSLNNNVSEF